MAGYEREVKGRLRKAGWERLRNPRGSHEIWSHDNAGRREISVPSKIKSRHTANSILKQAGLSKIER